MAFLSRLRRFVDWDFSTSYTVGGNGALFVAILPWLAFGLLRHSISPGMATTIMVLAGAFTIVWLTFVLWRWWRLSKAAFIRADRHYDREGKLNLSAEYRNTESSTKAIRRKRRG